MLSLTAASNPARGDVALPRRLVLRFRPADGCAAGPLSSVAAELLGCRAAKSGVQSRGARRDFAPSVLGYFIGNQRIARARGGRNEGLRKETLAHGRHALSGFLLCSLLLGEDGHWTVSTRGEESSLLPAFEYLLFRKSLWIGSVCRILLSCTENHSAGAAFLFSFSVSLRCPAAASRGWNLALQLIDLNGPN